MSNARSNVTALTATRRGFTLIEILVTLAIIIVLVAMLLPAIGKAKRTARKAAATQEVAALDQAWRSYLADHHGPPTNWSRGRTPDLEADKLQIDDKLAQMLMGQDADGNNPAKIRYMEFRRLDDTGSPVNPWWTPGSKVENQHRYWVKFDADYDNIIAAGGGRSLGGASPDNPPLANVAAPVICWTHNPDYKPTEDEYLIGSWK